MKNKQKQLEKKLFKMVYQWGRVGVVTDEKCFAFQEYIKDIRQQTIKEVIEMVEKTPIEKAHTYASENADEYRIYDAGQEAYKQTILQDLKSKLKK